MQNMDMVAFPHELMLSEVSLGQDKPGGQTCPLPAILRFLDTRRPLRADRIGISKLRLELNETVHLAGMTSIHRVLQTLNNLSSLSMTFNRVGGNFNMGRGFEGLPNLRHLELVQRNNKPPLDRKISVLETFNRNRLPRNLESLVIAGMEGITNAALRLFLETPGRHQTMRKLSLRRTSDEANDSWDDRSVQLIIQHLPQLEELELTHNTSLTDEAFTGIPRATSEPINETQSYHMLAHARHQLPEHGQLLSQLTREWKYRFKEYLPNLAMN
jgi:Fe-S cluster assembly iron-binding protein IscA